MSFKN